MDRKESKQVESNDLTKRIAILRQFSELQDGWLDGNGKSVTEDVLNLAERFLRKFASLHVQCTFGPIEEGGIQTSLSCVEFVIA